MEKKRNRLYEGMYILNSSLSEEALKKSIKKITETITKKGGEVHKIHEMGKKKLSYEIKGKKEGFYYLIYFTTNSSNIAPLCKEYNFHEDIIRFIIIQTKSIKEKLEYPVLKGEF
ncbi:MAG: 30S ribosomal protein S6 [Chlamydiae bacterium SM23_39]|nr:MAG: 30S ribosomal protein S6 [Chlamydiae bacterium SM23_39]